jgi:cytochrome c oxidase cbb3-type subunit 4
VDVNDLRNLVTVLSFVIFGAIVVWALSSRNKARFDEAANLPFVDDETGCTPVRLCEVTRNE